MQIQKQQTTHPPKTARKLLQRAAKPLRLAVFTLTFLLLIATIIFMVKTGATSPASLASLLATAMALVISFLALIPIFFPAQPQPAPIAPPGNPSAQAAIPASPQPLFRFNMSLKDPAEYYGRTHERTTLLSRTANGGSSSLVGERRIGKTWLLEYLQLVAPTHPNLGPRFRVGYLSATHPQCQTLPAFTLKALEALNIPVHHLDEAHIKFSHLAQAIIDLKDQQIFPVLCIDEFEGFHNKQHFNQAFFEGLRAMTQDGLVLITASKRSLADVITGMTGETSPFFNIIQQITLKPFTQAEAEKFIQDKSSQAGFDDQERIYFLKCATIYGPNGEKSWPPLRLQLVGQMLLDDKQRGPAHYQPQDLRYQLDFEKRLSEDYQAVVKQ